MNLLLSLNAHPSENPTLKPHLRGSLGWSRDPAACRPVGGTWQSCILGSPYPTPGACTGLLLAGRWWAIWVLLLRL